MLAAMHRKIEPILSAAGEVLTAAEPVHPGGLIFHGVGQLRDGRLTGHGGPGSRFPPVQPVSTAISLFICFSLCVLSPPVEQRGPLGPAGPGSRTRIRPDSDRRAADAVISPSAVITSHHTARRGQVSRRRTDRGVCV